MFPLRIQPWMNCRNIPQALALQIQAVLTLLFKNLDFHSELSGVRKNVSLTHSIISGPLVIWCWRLRREKSPCRCDPSAVVGRDRTTQMEESRLDLDFSPNHCLRHEPLPNSCGKSCIICSWDTTTTVPSQGGGGQFTKLSCTAQNSASTNLCKN